MPLNYKKHLDFVAKEIFSLGAPNKTGATVWERDWTLLYINRYIMKIISSSKYTSLLERMAIVHAMSNVFHLGNCGQQTDSLFLRLLTEGAFKERIEYIEMKGENLDDGVHYCLISDRDQKSDLNDPSTWKNATYLDTWSNEILSGTELTSLTKEQLAKKGNLSGEIVFKCIYARQEKLSVKECSDLIEFLTVAYDTLTPEKLKQLKNSLSAGVQKCLATRFNDEKLANEIRVQVSHDIARYRTVAYNSPGTGQALQRTILFLHGKKTIPLSREERAQAETGSHYHLLFACRQI